MIDELASLRELIGLRRPQLIGIDAMDGVGKTRRVGRPLGLPLLSLDTYLRPKLGFLHGLDYPRIEKDIATLPRPLVIEGCCLLAVMARLEVSLDLHVYLRLIRASGGWEDAEVGEGEWLDVVLKRSRAIAKAAKAGYPNLDYDLAVYHHEFRPYQSADLVLDLIQRPAD